VKTKARGDNRCHSSEAALDMLIKHRQGLPHIDVAPTSYAQAAGSEIQGRAEPGAFSAGLGDHAGGHPAAARTPPSRGHSVQGAADSRAPAVDDPVPSDSRSPEADRHHPLPSAIAADVRDSTVVLSLDLMDILS
jgi:hypothetical protein